MVEPTPFILTQYGSLENLEKYCRDMPKIELHAHINGSISPETLQQLVERKKEKKPHLAQFTIPKRKLDVINEFFSIFNVVYQLTDDDESIGYITESVILDFKKDGVQYLELRTTPRSDKNGMMTKESYVGIVLSVIQKFSYSEHGIIVKLILSIDRRNTLEEAMETVNLAIKYKNRGVVGVDLCGDPSKGHIDNVKPAFIEAKKHGLKVTLHFGEIEENIPEHASMLELSPDRLGHATHLDPESKDYISSKNIPVEMCMTSNVLSNTVKNYREHHIRDFLITGYKFCICTDDKGVFFSDLSTEYAIAASTFSLDPKSLFELSFQSIDCIFDNDETKLQLRKIWNDWYSSSKNSLLTNVND
ncbi:adenosine deaminase-like protein-like protein [Rhizophagus irregularis]|uniref:Adenosine deaminase-like protein-like protein n=3 Tax=Rhizophagus irregularis TaxID=588596 RepID=A0A2I1GHY3_9GLOM|nr:adenosine deaminase-like protein-like protein [Rhizophagus irregularis DAOM 181602=DAOM 197198]EXX71811.1 adenine deaminase [Rhizophagus irregularis DAOM 197198w]PKC10742.1 adenosine deaminase-like protein-like protein [Rhizophagus irregularis]PKY24114.1 adenosine deaminase-like protein-like protein [Rhizophagus irregularis]PKY46218.1 adenosine deaminase-like protein-like protein [Rhizophagus irregularis]POG80092.1 adenosine deaminase-like protein-like protein [Rhizophagus irregularis DAOM |eukprot:XP_025186958.1 adenosine deaminase-like protein-like protein [Rhizophagus irregularis DAOM 181602=DAOM 197198]